MNTQLFCQYFLKIKFIIKLAFILFSWYYIYLIKFMCVIGKVWFVGKCEHYQQVEINIL